MNTPTPINQELREHERQLLDYIERGGKSIPTIKDDFLGRAVNPEEFDLCDDEDGPRAF